jgi:hypothetical protein
LFTDDTSLLITSHKVHKFQNDLNTSFWQISKWFQVNSLSLNFRKTIFNQFLIKVQIMLKKTSPIKIIISRNWMILFWGLNINHTLSWKIHIDNILPKLCPACFAMRSVVLCVLSDAESNLLFLLPSDNVLRHNILGTFCK